MSHIGRVFVSAVVIAVAGRAPTPGSTLSAASAEPSVAPVASAPPGAPAAAAFPIAVFAGLGDEPVSDERAAELQSVLEMSANGDGLTATLVTPEGTWSGATGFAAGDRAMVPDDQMSIASITKTLVAAQVMQLVEAGELSLDDLAADRLPPDLEFDTNRATSRQPPATCGKPPLDEVGVIQDEAIIRMAGDPTSESARTTCPGSLRMGRR